MFRCNGLKVMFTENKKSASTGLFCHESLHRRSTSGQVNADCVKAALVLNSASISS